MKELYDYKKTIFLENGILNFICDNPRVDYEYLNDCINNRLLCYENKSFPLLVDISGLIYINKSAQARLMWQDAFQGINAVALLIANNVQLVICEYVLMKIKPQIPIKIFRKKTSATEWLNTYKD